MLFSPSSGNITVWRYSMPAIKSLERGTSFGSMANSLRLFLGLTRQEIAEIAGVTREEVDLFEHNFPVRLDARRKLLKALWAIKARDHKC